MKKATEKIVAWIKENNLNHNLSEEDDGDVLEIPCTMEKMKNATVFTIINDFDMQMILPNYVDVTEDVREEILEKVNELNSQYRWIKFQMSKDTVSASTDAVFNAETAVAVWTVIMTRMTQITDECYPEFMKIIWS